MWNSGSPKRRKRSPTPKPTKVNVNMLTRNVTKEHVHEIFSYFGTIRNIVMPTQDGRSWLSKGMAYVEYENYDHVAEAVKMMDGGQIDGQEIVVKEVLAPKPNTRRFSPFRPRERGGFGPRSGFAERRRGWSPQRGGFGGRRGFSPRRSPFRGGPRGRSRSPPPRRGRSPPRRIARADRRNSSPPKSRSPARRRRHSSTSSRSSSSSN